MIQIRRLLASVCLCTLVGCAAIGPTNSPEFPRLVEQAVPKQDGRVRLFGSGNWYPSTRGFTALRSSLLGRPGDPTPGVLVISDKSVLFEQWDEKAGSFDVIKRLALSDMMSVSLDSYGASRRIVIRLKDFSYESFDFTQASGNYIDAAKVVSAVSLLEAEISIQAK